jgi:TatD family-associated radical SAM protein
MSWLIKLGFFHKFLNVYQNKLTFENKMELERLVYSRGTTLYVNPSSRCTNDCLFCVRQFSEGVYGYPLTLERDPTVDEMQEAIRMKWEERYSEVAIVGFGEPLLNLDCVLTVAQEVRARSQIPIRINSNGHAKLIHPDRDVASELSAAGVNHIQISLNAQNAETYLKLCRPVFGIASFDSVLEFAHECKKSFSIEISVMDVPGIDIVACRRIATELGAEFKVRTFHGPEEVLGLIARNLEVFE